MTNEDDIPDIPDIISGIEGSLRTPDPAAIHAGLSKRQAVRKRVLGAAGAVVTVVALGAGALALTGDDATTTETASDDAPELSDFASQADRAPAVAEDSAPTELLVPAPDVEVFGWSNPIETSVRIEECSNGSRISTDGSQWHPGALPEAWAGQESVPVSAIIRGDELIAIDADSNAARFGRLLPNQAVPLPCNEFGGFSRQQLAAIAPATLEIVAAPKDFGFDSAFTAVTTTLNPDGNGTVTFASWCDPSSYQVEWIEDGFTVTEVGPHPARRRAVLCEDKGAPIFFSPGDTVRVTISPSLVVLDVEGETSWQLVLEKRLSDIEPSPLETPTETTTTTTTTSPPESTVSSTTTTAPTTTTTTTTEPVVAGPPAFSPSSNTVLSGRWEPVGMWKDGAAINLGGFSGNISVFGRSLSGNDGCNGHGSGGFYATPEGQVQLRPGVTTLVGCQESEILTAFNAGTFGANRWGRTSIGNLVLTNGSVVIEFALAEAAPTGSLRNLSAPLNTIWRSAQVADYDNFGPEGSGVTLTFSSNDGWDTAAVVIDECIVYGFDVTHAEGSEGSIAFSESSAAASEGCELTDNQALALEAFARADYFVTAGGNVQFWDGPQPLALFAHEEE